MSLCVDGCGSSAAGWQCRTKEPLIYNSTAVIDVHRSRTEFGIKNIAQIRGSQTKFQKHHNFASNITGIHSNIFINALLNFSLILKNNAGDLLWFRIGWNHHDKFDCSQGTAVIVSRAAAKAREALNTNNNDAIEEMEAELNNGVDNVKSEQNRYINFWIGVQKSLQIKHYAKKPMDPKMRSRFKKLEVWASIWSNCLNRWNSSFYSKN